eukprot:scaffold855_cov140-Skeletonema_menzelii.AAC.16
MVFACTGPTFTDMSLDYSINGQLIATITASSTWSEYTKGRMHINLAGKKYDDTFTLCDDLTSSSVACGYAGTVEVDLSGIAASHLGQNFTSSFLTTVITAAYIDFTAKPNGKKEHCKKQMLTSGYNSTNIDSTSTDSTIVSSQLDTTTTTTTAGTYINPALLYGGIALAVVVAGVGLAAYAMKRAKVSIGPVIKMKRIRSRSRSSTSLSSRSRSMPKNDAAEKLVDDEGVIV